MKQMTINIYDCYGCKNRGTFDRKTHFCYGHGRRVIGGNIFTEIPDWCPLPDAPNTALEPTKTTEPKSNTE
jgi:hypothetical protein